MDTEDEFGLLALQVLMQKAGPRLAAALAARGVSSPQQLSQAEASEILQNAIAATAIEHFPTIDVSKMLMGFRNFLHPRFFPALRTVQGWRSEKGDAFDPAVGPEAAIVLAGFGVPVVPLDKRDGHVIGEPSADLDVVASNFDRLKTAVVGYPAHEVEFYVLATDCLRTLKVALASDVRFAEIKKLMQRNDAQLPPDPGRPFRHFAGLFARYPGDRIGSVFFPDARADRGSVVFNAGWTEHGEPKGVRNGGYLPAFKSMVIEIANDPKTAFWLTEKATGEARRPN